MNIILFFSETNGEMFLYDPVVIIQLWEIYTYIKRNSAIMRNIQMVVGILSIILISALNFNEYNLYE